jgi:erythromycin esterase
MRVCVVILLCCCTSPQPRVGALRPSAPPPAAPALPPDPLAALDLDFETIDHGHPAAWSSMQADSEWGTANDVVHGGARSLRISPQTTEFVAVSTSADVAAFAGKHLRVHGWIRTQDVTAGAAVWLRADAPSGMALDNMGAAAPRGTTPWTEVVAEIDVPTDAKKLFIGAFVAGRGTAWFDDLHAEASTIEPPHAIVLAGSVVTTAGAPAAGAEVALVGLAGIDHHVTADASGHWQLAAMSGTWGLSASTADASGLVYGSAYASSQEYIELVVRDGVTVRGHTSEPPTAGTFVVISTGTDDTNSFVVPVAPDGSFRMQLPRSASYFVAVLDRGIGNASAQVTGDRVDITLPYSPLLPPPHDVVDWVSAHAIAIDTVEAGHDFDDLAPLARTIGNAHVIALGEATHGTREFFQMKHRMLEYLVAKLGVTEFAIEANQPECRAIDAYVIDGKGDAKQALAGTYFWTWNTEEVLALIEWMRQWNADPAHHHKVHFVGIDMQESKVAFASVLAYLGQVGADVAVATAFDVLGRDDAMQVVAQLAPDARAKLAAALAKAAELFDENRASWSGKHTDVAFADARHDVTVLQQATAMYAATGLEPYEIRDRSMADNIAWLRSQAPSSMRMMVWAHNGHISSSLPSFVNTGNWLRKRYGRDYVNVGFVFGDGSFQAMDGIKGHKPSLAEFTVGPAPETDGSQVFLGAGKPLLALDLHAIPATGAVHDWFAHPHPFREIGAMFSGEPQMAQPMNLPALYDAVIFVAHTTRARELAR